MKKLAITMGDAAGVGPEIILKTMKVYPEYQEKCVIYGAVKVLEYYNERQNLGLEIQKIQSIEEWKTGAINVIDPQPISVEDFLIGELSAVCGDCAYRYLQAAVGDAARGMVQAVVTAPLNKEALHMGGHLYAGHTEILADLTGTKNYAMLLWSPRMKVIHATTHVSLWGGRDQRNHSGH